MVSYIAHDKKSGLVACGGLHQVVEWSRRRIANKAPKAVIAIIKCRPDAAGRVIAEITFDGGRIIDTRAHYTKTRCDFIITEGL